MRALINILIIVLLTSVLVWSVEPFTPEHLDPVKATDSLAAMVKTLQSNIDKTNRNFDKLARRLRWNDAYTDSQQIYYPQSGIGNTGALSVVTVYLPVKYNSTNFTVLVSARGNASDTYGIYHAVFNDSSFNVYTTEDSKDFGWATFGDIRR